MDYGPNATGHLCSDLTGDCNRRMPDDAGGAVDKQILPSLQAGTLDQQEPRGHASNGQAGRLGERLVVRLLDQETSYGDVPVHQVDVARRLTPELAD